MELHEIFELLFMFNISLNTSFISRNYKNRIITMRKKLNIIKKGF